jgi:hypothetical protein
MGHIWKLRGSVAGPRITGLKGQIVNLVIDYSHFIGNPELT